MISELFTMAKGRQWRPRPTSSLALVSFILVATAQGSTGFVVHRPQALHNNQVASSNNGDKSSRLFSAAPTTSEQREGQAFDDFERQRRELDALNGNNNQGQQYASIDEHTYDHLVHNTGRATGPTGSYLESLTVSPSAAAFQEQEHKQHEAPEPQTQPQPQRQQLRDDILPYYNPIEMTGFAAKKENFVKNQQDNRVVKAKQDPDAALQLLRSELGVSRVVIGDEFPIGRGGIPLDMVVERTLDTVEDSVVMARRGPEKKGWSNDYIKSKQENRPTVVVLGSGWGAHAFIKVADAFRWRIVVISPSNHFVFTPMLASAAVGTVEYRSMTEAIRKSNPMIESFVEGRATSVDVQNQVLDVQLESLLEDTKVGDGTPAPIRIKYDKLIVAVGVKVATRMVPGAHDYCLRLKTSQDAKLLRTAIGQALEYASRSECQNDPQERRRRATFAVVGGGPTGVELAGELSDFLKDVTNPQKGVYNHLANDVNVILMHGGKDLVPQFDQNLRDHARDTLVKRGVDVKLNTRVQEVGETFIKWYDKNDPLQEVQTLEVGLKAWCAGTVQRNFTQTLLKQLPPEAKGHGGSIEVDRWLRCPTGSDKTFGSVMILGDAASCKENSHFDASLLPQTAQVAGQQGAFAARILCRGYDMSVTPPRLREDDETANLRTDWLKLRGLKDAPRFEFLNLGQLAYVGGGEALTQVELGDVPIFSYAGSVAFLLWRSVYLVKQVATRNRVLLVFDWMKSSVFGRDITRL
jgi:NADH dehydrogenase FAD-containing subunit